MTEQERQMISELAERMKSAPAPQIDRDANALIQSAIGARPDAVYVLTQTVLIQQMALEQAKAQIDSLKQSGASFGQGQGSFLPRQGSGQGYGQGGAPVAQPGAPPAGGGYSQSRYSGQAPPQPPPPQQVQGVVYEEAPRRSGFSDFLHNAAQTAAGVMAGELAFDALSGIFGHHGGYGYGGGGFLGGGGIVPGGETIINNYYGDQGGGDRGGDDSRFADAAASSGDNMSPDIEDDRDKGDRDSLMGAGSDDDSAGNDSDDNSGDDNSGDGGSYDDSGDDYSGGDSGGDSGF